MFSLFLFIKPKRISTIRYVVFVHIKRKRISTNTIFTMVSRGVYVRNLEAQAGPASSLFVHLDPLVRSSRV